MVFSMTDKYVHWNGGSRVSAGINNTGSPRNILEHFQIIWELEGAHIQYPGLEHCAPAQTNCHSFALLVESLLELNRVKDVNFNHNALSAACCASLAELLQFSPLEALHLKDVGFYADALLMLADGINLNSPPLRAMCPLVEPNERVCQIWSVIIRLPTFNSHAKNIAFHHRPDYSTNELKLY
ncbi:hypothetical protein MIR68_007202 [Amoeboaphelidium protococcarum]|nr:hypothetical protein MIR68_007202 [Amoeboaphelidium protococcarum]